MCDCCSARTSARFQTVDAVYDGEDAYAYGLSDNYDGIFSRSAMSSQLSKYRL